jgi:hypothetical protein
MGKRAVSISMVIAFAIIGYFATAPKYAHQAWDWRDYTAIASVALLVWWLLSHSRGSSLKGSSGHESADNPIALRFGKALNKVRRSFRR